MEPNEYVDFNYTGNIQTFTVPNTGYYKLEVYGAEGGRGGWYFSRHWCDGGKGGHAVGYKRLRKGTVLYIGVGGRGNDISGGYGSGWLWTSTPGGYNGGGTGYAQDTGAYDPETQEHTWRGINSGAGSGGGATHIAYNQSALLKDTNQNNILIAAGGGGGGWIGSAGWGSDYGPFSSGGGTLQTTDVAIASGDKLVITDSSDSNKIARSSLSFDGSTTTQFLSKKGTFETPTISVTITENTTFNISEKIFKIALAS